MALKRTLPDPGTADAGPWWPFRVTPAGEGGSWVQVRPGELWTDPGMEGGYCFPEIRGLMLPFQIFPTSFIYLQVWMNLQGNPIWASICHTSWDKYHFGEKNSMDKVGVGAMETPVNWTRFAHDRWLNWPNLYALDRYVPYYGVDYYQAAEKGQPDFMMGPVIPTKGKLEARDKGGDPINQSLNGKTESWRVGVGGLAGALHPSRLTARAVGNPDNAVSMDVNAGMPTDGQLYGGVNRELRKELGAHRNVGWFPEVDDPIQGYRRANLGATVPEIGGHYCPNKEWVYDSDTSVRISTSIKQQERFLHTWEYLKESCFEAGSKKLATYKREYTESRQLLAYYPIAYAVSTPREDSNYFDGISVKGKVDGKDTTFKLIQACKTNLQFHNVAEGDMKLKIIQPYQGMGSFHRHAANGNGSNTFPDFVQTYPHNMTSDVKYRRVSIDAGATYNAAQGEGGGYATVNGRSGPKGGEDFFPYPQSYVDKMFNQQ